MAEHSHRSHTDGTPCTCEPTCTCHPPTRDEPAEAIYKRGSFHLRTCPAFGIATAHSTHVPPHDS